ncbi:MAG TPA: hypothetical protein PKB02_19355 [Anaerohalosphaeraceae bacterium]|nr:hypothetical protein [Anaerohalosphaeraceae bacterium]
MKIQNNTLIPAERAVEQLESAADTIWNSSGTTMTSINSLWNTAGPNQVVTGDIVRIIDGINASPGRYTVASVNSNTSISLDRSIGINPRQVSYEIYKTARWAINCGDYWDHVLCSGNTVLGPGRLYAPATGILLGVDWWTTSNPMGMVVSKNNRVDLHLDAHASHGFCYGEGADGIYVQGDIARLPDEAWSGINIAGVVKLDYGVFTGCQYIGYRGLYLKGANHCRVTHCTAKSLGTNALEFILDSDTPCNNTIEYCIIDGSEGTYCIHTNGQEHDNNHFDNNCYYYGSARMINIANANHYCPVKN